MRNICAACVLVLLMATFSFAAAPVVQNVVPVLRNLQMMQINETHRMKVSDPKEFSSAKIAELKKGDDVEVKKIGPDKFEVKHLPTGKTSVMTRQ